MTTRIAADKAEKFILLLFALLALGTLILAIRLDILVAVFGIALVLSTAAVLLYALFRVPATLLIVYILLLPANSLALALLYKLTGSSGLINTLQPWKEILGLLLLGIFCAGVLQRLKLPAKVHRLDLLVAFMLALDIVYLLLPIGPDLTTRLYGFRAAVFFMLMYVLGRTIPISGRHMGWIIAALMVIGALGGLLAVFEKLALPPTWPVSLGYPSYLSEFFGQSPQGHYGLTWTFETGSGWRRASAFFANPLDLASSTLVTGMASLYMMFYFKPRTVGRWTAALCWILVVISLLLSISRASMIAFPIQTFAASIWLNQRRFAILIVSIGLVGLVVAIAAIGPDLLEYIRTTLNFQNSSSQGHLLEWTEGLEAVIEHPFGLGLGTSGQVGGRFDLRTGGENQFVIVGVQTGVVGLALYLALQICAIGYSLSAYSKLSGYAKALAFIAAFAKFGLLVPSFTANIDNYLFVTVVAWWLVGLAIQNLTRHSRATKYELSSKRAAEAV